MGYNIAMKIIISLLLLISATTITPAIAGWKPAASEAWKNRAFTAEELKKYTGRNGMPAYVAVDGIVYDVSKASKWKNGAHMKMHQAGADLSEELRTYTHEKGDILEKIPKVGVISAKAAGASGKTAAVEKPEPASVLPHKIGKKELGRTAVCPVTGERLKTAAATPAAEYNGRIYYFCCPPCYGHFTEDPEKYLNTTNAAE